MIYSVHILYSLDTWTGAKQTQKVREFYLNASNEDDQDLLAFKSPFDFEFLKY